MIDSNVSAKPENAQQTEALNGKVELKPISQIVVGDEVLAFSEWRDKGEISNQDQRLSYEKVTDVYTSYKQQVLVHLSLDNGATITATEGHPFKTDEGWRDAIMLKKGGKLLLKGGDEEEANKQLLLQPKVDDKNALSSSQSGLPTSDSTRTITEIRLEKKVVAVYNLEVANAHTFFVGEDGVLVHNSDPGIYIDYGDYDGVTGHYVGQSNDTDQRLKEHQKHPKKKNHTRICEIPMPGSSTRDRDRMENFIYDTFGVGVGAGTQTTKEDRRTKESKCTNSLTVLITLAGMALPLFLSSEKRSVSKTLSNATFLLFKVLLFNIVALTRE